MMLLAWRERKGNVPEWHGHFPALDGPFAECLPGKAPRGAPQSLCIHFPVPQSSVALGDFGSTGLQHLEHVG
jgi:hypothetical protein